MHTKHAYRKSRVKVLAFTLIELLVVIAIISLLVSILLPSLTKAKGLVKSVVCLSNQRGIATALALYASENEGLFPPALIGTQGTQDQWTYDRFLQEYTGDIVEEVPTSSSPLIEERDIFACPSDEQNRISGKARSYSLCVWYASAGYPVRPLATEWYGYSTCVITSQVANPGDTFILAEWHAYWNRRLGNFPGAYIRYHEFINGWSGNLPPAENPAHDKKSNFLFIDGHASSLLIEDATDEDYWKIVK